VHVAIQAAVIASAFAPESTEARHAAS
jgi:hypothetical protein